MINYYTLHVGGEADGATNVTPNETVTDGYHVVHTGEKRPWLTGPQSPYDDRPARLPRETPVTVDRVAVHESYVHKSVTIEVPHWDAVVNPTTSEVLPEFQVAVCAKADIAYVSGVTVEAVPGRFAHQVTIEGWGPRNHTP